MGILITETGLEYLNDKLVRVNKRAEKLGVDGLRLELTPADPVQDESGAFYLQYYVEIKGTPPVLGDYLLVAIKECLSSDNDAIIIRTVPDTCLPVETVIPDWFVQETDMFCGHCHTRRGRHEVFLLRKRATQEYVQVGRNCLKDFLGVDVSAWLARAEWMLDIEEMYTMAGIYSQPDRSVDKRYLPLDQVFKYVYASATRKGFVSKKRSMEDGSISTIESAMQQYHEDKIGRSRFGKKRNEAYPPPTEEETAAAADLLEWFKKEILPVPEKHYFGDDIMWGNLQHMCDHNMISLRMTGISVIPYVMWLKYKADKLREEERGVSNWVGNVGEKIKLKAKVIYMQTIESAYGPMTIHKFLTEDKNVLCWFQSAGSSLRLEENEELVLAGTVKGHKEYRGQKETVLKGVKQVVS